MDETPLRERIMMKRSPAHVKTLDILAKSSKFAAQLPSNLRKYCALARSESGATNEAAAGAFLQDRYGWEVHTRAEDFAQAWADSCEAPTLLGASPAASASVKKTPAAALESESRGEVHSGRVYLSLKKDACSKCTLLCQIEDHQRVKFTGDAGAIGRLTVKDGSTLVTIDLKGQQYEGELLPGPTVLVISTAHNPFAKTSAAAPAQERMKVEAITNEFCHFKFKKDLMSDLIGTYTGDVACMQPPTKTPSSSSSSSGMAKKRKKGDDDDEEEEGGGSERDEDKGRQQRRPAGARNPKITTINRKQGKEKKKRRASGASKK